MPVRRTAAVLDLGSGELAARRLVGAPEDVVEFLVSLPGPVLAVYEAGRPGSGLPASRRREGSTRG